MYLKTRPSTKYWQQKIKYFKYWKWNGRLRNDLATTYTESTQTHYQSRQWDIKHTQ